MTVAFQGIVRMHMPVHVWFGFLDVRLGLTGSQHIGIQRMRIHVRMKIGADGPWLMDLVVPGVNLFNEIHSPAADHALYHGTP